MSDAAYLGVSEGTAKAPCEKMSLAHLGYFEGGARMEVSACCESCQHLTSWTDSESDRFYFRGSES